MPTWYDLDSLPAIPGYPQLISDGIDEAYGTAANARLPDEDLAALFQLTIQTGSLHWCHARGRGRRTGDVTRLATFCGRSGASVIDTTVPPCRSTAAFTDPPWAAAS